MMVHILKGAKPGDLPGPSSRPLNLLKTAKRSASRSFYAARRPPMRMGGDGS